MIKVLSGKIGNIVRNATIQSYILGELPLLYFPGKFSTPKHKELTDLTNKGILIGYIKDSYSSWNDWIYPTIPEHVYKKIGNKNIVDQWVKKYSTVGSKLFYYPEHAIVKKRRGYSGIWMIVKPAELFIYTDIGNGRRYTLVGNKRTRLKGTGYDTPQYWNGDLHEFYIPLAVGLEELLNWVIPLHS